MNLGENIEEQPLFSKEFMEKRGVETPPAEEGTKEEKTTTGVEDTNPEPGGQQEGKEAEGQEQPKEGADNKPPEGETLERGQEGEETKQTEFDIETFNKFFEKDFKSVDDVKGLLEKVEQYSDYDEKSTKLSEYESTLKAKEQEIEQLKDSLDPLKWFKDEKSFKAEMIKKQFPDRDPVLIEKVIKSDLTKQDDFNTLIDDYLMENPALQGDRTRAAALLRKRYGIDPEDSPEDWEQVTKDELMVDANKAKKKFQQLSEEIEMPEVVSPEEKEQQKQQEISNLKESWKEPLNRIAQYDKEVIKDKDGNTMLEFEIPDSFKSQISEYTEAMVTSGEFPVNEQSLAFVEDSVRKLAIAEYLPKMMEVYKGQLESEWQRQKDEEEGNTKPPNKDTAPEPSKKSDGRSVRHLGSDEDRPTVLG